MINAFIRSESSVCCWALPTGACCTVVDKCFMYRPSINGTCSLNLYDSTVYQGERTWELMQCIETTQKIHHVENGVVVTHVGTGLNFNE